jgi:hypothetical protein
MTTLYEFLQENKSYEGSRPTHIELRGWCGGNFCISSRKKFYSVLVHSLSNKKYFCISETLHSIYPYKFIVDFDYLPPSYENEVLLLLKEIIKEYCDVKNPVCEILRNDRNSDKSHVVFMNVYGRFSPDYLDEDMCRKGYKCNSYFFSQLIRIFKEKLLMNGINEEIIKNVDNLSNYKGSIRMIGSCKPFENDKTKPDPSRGVYLPPNIKSFQHITREMYEKYSIHVPPLTNLTKIRKEIIVQKVIKPRILSQEEMNDEDLDFILDWIERVNDSYSGHGELDKRNGNIYVFNNDGPRTCYISPHHVHQSNRFYFVKNEGQIFYCCYSDNCKGKRVMIYDENSEESDRSGGSDDASDNEENSASDNKPRKKREKSVVRDYKGVQYKTNSKTDMRQVIMLKSLLDDVMKNV